MVPDKNIYNQINDQGNMFTVTLLSELSLKKKGIFLTSYSKSNWLIQTFISTSDNDKQAIILTHFKTQCLSVYPFV